MANMNLNGSGEPEVRHGYDNESGGFTELSLAHSGILPPAVLGQDLTGFVCRLRY